MRVFTTQAAYDSYRNGLGEANVFPPASSMFMSFEKDVLALYTRGNDTGGRCFGTTTSASLDGEAVTLELAWQNGTCGAPVSAHYPFILVSLSRAAADGSSWATPARSVCASAPGVADSRSCASLSGTATPTPTAQVAPPPVPMASPPAATAVPTATRTLTPSLPATASPVAVASPTAASTVAPARSPLAVASPAPAAADPSTNYLLYGMLIAIGFLVGVALMLSRSSGRRR
jgi:hypothetical protein